MNTIVKNAEKNLKLGKEFLMTQLRNVLNVAGKLEN